jgi:hypothetical protein
VNSTRPDNPPRFLEPACELHRGARLAAARIGVQQDDVLIVEGPVELEDGLVPADEAHVGRLRQRRIRGGAGLELDCKPGFRLREQSNGRRFEYRRDGPILDIPPAALQLPFLARVAASPSGNPEASAAYRSAMYCAAVSTKTL